MSYKDIYGYVILIVIILFIVGIFVKIIIRKINKKIKVIKVDNVRVFDLANNCVFDNEYDDKLFSMMYEASNNGILEINEFYEWDKHYDMKFLVLFARIEEDIINNLKKEKRIYYRITRDECKYRYVMVDKIYEDSIKLYGFKKFLSEFYSMDMK